MRFYMMLSILLLLWCSTEAMGNSLQWNQAEGVTGFRVYYAPMENDICDIQNLSVVDVGAVTQYSIDLLPLTEGVTYCFAIKAYNNFGESDFSRWTAWAAEDNTPPSPPENIRLAE